MDHRASLRILAVEDDAAVVRTWLRLLQGRVELHHAATFEAAWRLTQADAWKERAYDHVLLDLRLPDGDGEDLLLGLAGLSPRPGVAVVSGFLDARRVLRLHGRCTVIVPKPADGDVLLGVIGLLEEARNGRSVVSEFARQNHLSPQET